MTGRDQVMRNPHFVNLYKLDATSCIGLTIDQADAISRTRPLILKWGALHSVRLANRPGRKAGAPNGRACLDLPPQNVAVRRRAGAVAPYPIACSVEVCSQFFDVCVSSQFLQGSQLELTYSLSADSECLSTLFKRA